MSKNSQDEPDEYEVIFDGKNADLTQEAAIEVSDGEILGNSEYIDAEVDAADGLAKDSQDEIDDQDIDDGIFAPVRKEKPKGKKNASLMWAVSLLAFVGVGAFVYVANPDILSKVTSNLEGVDAVLPNNSASATSVETTEVASDSESAPVAGDEAIDAHLQDSDTITIKPDTVTDNSQPETLHQDTPPDLQDVASEMVEPSVTSPTSSDASSDTKTETVVAISPAGETPIPPTKGDNPVAVATKAPEVENDVNVNPVGDTPASVAENTVNKSVAPEAVPSSEANAPIADIDPIPASSEIIVPTDDNDDEGDIKNGAHDNASETPTLAVVPATAEPSSTSLSTTSQTKVEQKVSKNQAPVIKNSKEEQKVLDDANLDKYFDSPNGKILKDIPAPSMNPISGNNQSVIIVNKKGQKTNTDYPKPAGKINVETTSLSPQIISANRAMKLGRYEAAKEMYDDLYKLNPRDGQILSGRALLLQKMGFADQAISAYEELLKLYPDNTDAIVNLSGLIRKQYPAVALSKLLDLHMSYPNNAVVTAQLGVAYADTGNYTEALRYLGDAAAMEPKNPLHFYNMAVVSEKASKSQQAVSYYEKALELDAIYGDGNKTFSREKIYDRLAQIRGN